MAAGTRAAQRANKKALSCAAATAAEGKDQNTNTHEGEPIMTETTPAPFYPATAIAEAIADIEACPDGHIVTLNPDSALFQEVTGSLTKPLAWLNGYGIGREHGEWIHRALALDASGVPATLPDEEALKEYFSARPRLRQAWADMPNSVVHIKGILVISLGRFFPISEVVVDGETHVELVTWDEIQGREQAAQSDYLARYPEILAARPIWAETTSVADLDENGADVMYEWECGEVTVSLSARHENGQLQFDSEDPYVEILEHEGLTVVQMASIANNLLKASEVLGAV